jgi:hypothetical protein
MIELLLPSRFDTLEYSWVKATIGIYTLVDYYVAKKHQQARRWPSTWPFIALKPPTPEMTPGAFFHHVESSSLFPARP